MGLTHHWLICVGLKKKSCSYEYKRGTYVWHFHLAYTSMTLYLSSMAFKYTMKNCQFSDCTSTWLANREMHAHVWIDTLSSHEVDYSWARLAASLLHSWSRDGLGPVHLFSTLPLKSASLNFSMPTHVCVSMRDDFYTSLNFCMPTHVCVPMRDD